MSNSRLERNYGRAFFFFTDNATCSNGITPPPGFEFFFGSEKAYKDMDTVLSQSDGVALCEANSATISDMMTEDEFNSMMFMHGKTCRVYSWK